MKTDHHMLQAKTGISLLLIALVFIAVYAVLFTPGYSEQLRTVVVTAVVSGLLGHLSGYWLDSTASADKAGDVTRSPGGVTTTTTQVTPPEDTDPRPQGLNVGDRHM